MGGHSPDTAGWSLVSGRCCVILIYSAVCGPPMSRYAVHSAEAAARVHDKMRVF